MDSPFLGMVQYFAFDFVPKGYASANGALLSIQQNAALFALLGTYYGGNGTTTFALPDLRGRAIVGYGTNYSMGEVFGTNTVSILTSNMPMHTHTVPSTAIGAFVASGRGGDSNDPTNAYPASPSSGTQYGTTPGANQFLATPSVTVGAAGQSIPVNTQSPYIAITATISTIGIFPSRN